MNVLLQILALIGSASASAGLGYLAVLHVKERKDVAAISRQASGWSWYGTFSALILPAILGLFSFAFAMAALDVLGQIIL